MIKTRIKKNDNVIIIAGSERGHSGKVLFVDRKKGKIVVEGINKKKKFVRPTQENPKGGIINLEYPIHISNVQYFCEKCKIGVRIGIQIKNDDKARICKKCGKSFDS
ncbi:MAG: 50S ribosomal protein L24 [Spirochaetota bacterium]